MSSTKLRFPDPERWDVFGSKPLALDCFATLTMTRLPQKGSRAALFLPPRSEPPTSYNRAKQLYTLGVPDLHYKFKRRRESEGALHH